MTTTDIPRASADEAGEKASEKLRKAAAATRTAGAEMAQDLREAGGAAAAEVRDRAADAAAAVADAASERAGAARDALASAGDSAARSLRDAAARSEPESLQARALNLAATGLQEVARGLNGQSLSGLMASARDTARRNPAVCIAGAALAGFALVRFLRSGEAANARTAPQDA
ncbi:MAG TPA: hypothetical protein PKC84_10545 [Paracoccaceae bacterium]|nr:hypothetical protein [Paracoccaceae bacterium]